MKIVHYERINSFWNTKSICNQLYDIDPERVTLDVDKVTCKNCVRILNAKKRKNDFCLTNR